MAMLFEQLVTEIGIESAQVAGSRNALALARVIVAASICGLR